MGKTNIITAKTLPLFSWKEAILEKDSEIRTGYANADKFLTYYPFFSPFKKENLHLFYSFPTK